MEISRELLTKLYVKQQLKQKDIADKLNINISLVNYYCQKYNLGTLKRQNKHKRSQKHWSEEEKELLMSLYGTCSYEVLSKKLGRSESSIESMKYKLKLGKTIEYTDVINSNELARALNRAPYAIRSWINNNNLPGVKKTLKFKKWFYRIDIDKFWKWAKNNPLMDWTKYEIGNLPNEPEWVLEVKKKAVKKTRRPWTKTEESLLEFYYKQGILLKEIAKKLNRTFKSVDMRIIKLGIERKNIQLDWQPIEVNTMLDMIDEGKTLMEVAEEIGRTYNSVSKKYLFIKNMSEISLTY